MWSEMIVGLLSLAGTLLGSVAGILAANKLTNFRITQLERKVEKHNNLVERMTIAEEKIKSIGYRLEEMKEEIE